MTMDTDSDGLALPTDLGDDDLLGMNWPDLDLEDIKNIDIELDPDKVGLLKDISLGMPFGHLNEKNEFSSTLDTLSEVTDSKNYLSQILQTNTSLNLSTGSILNNTIITSNNSGVQNAMANQKVQEVQVLNQNAISSTLPVSISPTPHCTINSFQNVTLPDNRVNVLSIPSKIISTNTVPANYITNSPKVQNQQTLGLTGSTLVQISPNQVQPQVVRRVIPSIPASTGVSQVLQPPSTVIQQVVLSKNETTIPTATVLYKTPTLATISQPIQRSDTAAIVTAIPLVLDSERVPVARIIGHNINQPLNNTFPREKKSSHNEIEKRYRCSINDKILELKNLVAGEEAKLHKSQILKKAIDYIKYLINQNTRLRSEVNSYRMRENKQKLSTEFGCVSPPYSDSSSPQHSPLSESSLPPSPESTKLEGVKDEQLIASNSPNPQMVARMTDRTRMVLCMMMFAIFALNPIGIITPKEIPYVLASGEAKSGRTLMNLEDDAPMFLGNLIRSSFVVWFLNAVILAMFMLKVFVYGEPCLRKSSFSYDSLKKYITQGDLEAAKGNYNGASHKYCNALLCVGRPLPISLTEKILALQWQIFHQIFQRFLFGKWLSKYTGGFFLEKDLRETMDDTVRECALITHKLNKLHLMGYVDDSSHMLGLYLAMSSLNLSECTNLDDGDRADILATCALRARESLPSRWHLSARFLLSRTRRVCERAGEVPEGLQWLYSPKGQRFFVSHKWSYDARRKSLFSNFTDKANPLGYLLVLYREHLLERSVSTLVNPGQRAEDVCENDFKRPTKTADVLDYIDLLRDTYAAGSIDEINQWWSYVFKIAVDWLLGEDVTSLYHSLEPIPYSLKTSPDPLALAAVHALRARKEKDTLPAYSVIHLCDRAGDAVADSINISSCKEDDSILQYVQVLVLDWILDVRTAIWERETASDCDTLTTAPAPMIQGFQADLTSLRKLIDIVPGVLQRVFLHEATMRMMAGASPARTQQLLDRSLRHRYRTPSAICGKDKDIRHSGGEREHATALMMACRHLPSQLLSSPGERAGMLAEAAKTLEKIGDTKKMQDCYKLMKNMGTGVSTYC